MSEFVLDFDSSETGAPVLNNVPGSLIGVIDAVAITGFNNRAITSLVVAAGVATATCAGHGYSGGYGGYGQGGYGGYGGFGNGGYGGYGQGGYGGYGNGGHHHHPGISIRW